MFYTISFPSFFSALEDFLFYTKIFLSPNQIFHDPYLLPQEKVAFFKYLNQSHIYFEYRSGGTTHQAAIRGLKIYTVEVGLAWIIQLQKEIAAINSYLKTEVDITYLLADYQSKENFTFQDFLEYVQIYDQKYQADLIYIDGEYLMSCLFNLFNKVSQDTVIFAHDLDLLIQRKEFKLINEYFNLIEQCDRSYILKKKIKKTTLHFNVLTKIEEKDFYRNNKEKNVFSVLVPLSRNIINKYQYYNDSNIMNFPSKHIWFFWWQGIESAPEVVKLCLSSIRRNLPNIPITVITKDNLFDLVDIPSYVIDALDNKRISFTHFSDIVRMMLLTQKGGCWIDATIFVGKKLPENLFDYPYYTIRFNDTFKYVTGKWCSFLTYSVQNNIVPRFCSEILLEYLKHHDRFLCYFILDFILLLGYRYIPSFQRMIQSVPYNNPKVLQLFPLLNDNYSSSYLDILL